MIPFNQADIAIFVAYALVARSKLNPQKDTELIKSYLNPEKPTTIDIIPCCLSLKQDGLHYISATQTGETHQGIIPYKELGLDIDINLKKNKEKLNSFSEKQQYKILKTHRSKILDALSRRGHTTPEYQGLQEYIFQFSGLCELICNLIVMEDLMGEQILTNYEQDTFKIPNTDIHNRESTNIYKKNITLFKLNQPKIINSHIVNVYSFFQKLIALFFDIYPHNLFSYKEKIRNSDNTVNEALLKNKLGSLTNGTYIKFLAFTKKNCFNVYGHSMLIKKISDNKFAFFEPRIGEKQNLDITELCQEINNSMKRYKVNKMAFIDAQKFMNELNSSLDQNNTKSYTLQR